jgi:hypothetical protein
VSCGEDQGNMKQVTRMRAGLFCIEIEIHGGVRVHSSLDYIKNLK